MSPIGGATKYNGTMQALFAVAAMGAKFYDGLGLKFGESMRDKTLFEHTRQYGRSIRDAVVATREDAKANEAFLIEMAPMGGYRLCRMAKTGGHSYSGETFRTWEDFWRAMRTLEDVTRHVKGEHEV